MALRMATPWKHPKTGIYHFRRRVPSDLVATLGKKEHKVSLGTKDPATAKERHAEKWTEYAKLEKLARAKPAPLSQKTITALAGEAYRQLIETTDDEPGETEIWNVLLERIDHEANSGNLEGWYGKTADKVLNHRGLKADDYSRERLLVQIHEAVKQGAEVARRKSLGDYRADPDAGRFPEIDIAPTKSKASGQTMHGLFDLWRKRHLANGKAEGTPDDHYQKLKSFIDFVGHDDAIQVAPKDVADWCDHLQFEKGIAARTVRDKYLSALRAIFNVGVKSFVIDKNPAYGIAIDVVKGRRTRPKGFTNEEAERILRHALKAEMSGARSSAYNKLACRWIPWICAYTGARAGEVAQLRREDLTEMDGIPVIVITPEAGTVKTREYRNVPTHPHLIDQGLLEFVRGRPNGPLFYVPNNKPRKPGNTQAGNVRDKVCQWVRKTVGVDDPRIQPNHAWRHRFKTLARDVDMPHQYQDAILGHADGRASSDYGESSMKALLREIEKLPRHLSGEPTNTR